MQVAAERAAHWNVVANAMSSPHVAIPRLSTATPLQREVLGFVNASNLGDPSVGYPSWNFSLLSTVVYFGIQVNSGDGHLVTYNTGWNVYHSTTMTNFVNTAHASGTRVLVSLNLHDFSTSSTNQVCQGLIASNAQATINSILTEVANAGIDGVSIDYEGQDTVCANGLSERQQLVSFVQNMRAAMPRGMYLSIDTYSGSAEDNLEFFNVTGLAPYVDSFFVMAYDMDYANSTELPLSCSSYCFNPISPLNTYRFNVSKSMSQYTALVPSSKVILGQPYYGRRSCVPNLTDAHQYPVPNTNFVSPTYAFASTIPSQSGVSNFASHRDPGDGFSEWDTWYDSDWSCNREQYFDDVTSLGVKYDLVNADDLRGVGFFTLDYAGGSAELWNLIAAKFTTTTAWDSLGGIASSSPDISSGNANQLDVFVRGTDNALWHKSWNRTAWSNWETLGGILTSKPASASWASDRTDVFVRGSDNALYHKNWNGTSWSNWENLGGVLTSGPAAASWNLGHLDVFVRGTDNALYHKWFELGYGGWSSWERLGGYLTSDPVAVSWSYNRLDIFVRGTDYQLYHRFWDGLYWSNWEGLGGYLTSGPAASSCTSGHLDVFVNGTDHGVWQKGWDGNVWTAWKPLGGRFAADPGASCLTGTSSVAMVQEGIDAAIWHTSIPAT